MENHDYVEVPLTLGVALALWAGAVAAGTSAGVFPRLPQEVVIALAAFAVAFALAVVTVDERVRGWLERRSAKTAWLALLGVATILAFAIAALARQGAPDPAQAPWAPVLLFVVPVTVALAASALRGPARAAAVALTRRAERRAPPLPRPCRP